MNRKERQGADRTARFWTWVNGGWVKLSLRYDRDLRVCYGGQTDEGHSACETTWTHTGDGVLEEWADWGRDCDGAYEAGGKRFCPLGELAGDQTEAGPPFPLWRKGDRWQRDHTAEAAGY